MASPLAREPELLTGEEVVISGMSGIFPKSGSVQEFSENLYNKVDMVDKENLNFDHPEAPKHYGKIKGTREFDAQFFRVTYNQAVSLDPMCRKLMEHAYSAMYDSGINPLSYYGKKIGVFVSTSYLDSATMSLCNAINQNGFILSGTSGTMFANRISYWIDGKGPSFSIDNSCAGSMTCLEHAYNAIKTGLCEAAIVGGGNLCVHPHLSLNLKKYGVLCLDGKTKCFDKNGDGYVRSETINVFFLQKAKHAKRIYTEVYYAQIKYGLYSDLQFSNLRTSEQIEDFLNDFYSEVDISPKHVKYIEAHGSAISAADAHELNAIGNVFAKESPVTVGCVKSNMGNSESAAGICALTKACLAYQRGQLPANLHYSEPMDISPVQDGRLLVLQENAPFDRRFMAINNFSLCGINSHVLLKGHFKEMATNRYNCNIPRIVLVSGRQENCVANIFAKLKNHPINPEEIGLLHNIYETVTPGHTCRGYTVLDTNDSKQTLSLSQGVEYYSGTNRPLWLVYSGMGSQWAGMGAELMRIPIFAAAIEKCRIALQPKSIDIVRIITDPDETIFDNILHSFVGIAAVQIGLTDILKELGIIPDNIIGHSVGEMGCAYFDGCFTAEEMILSAYNRGLVSVQSEFIYGSMAAVGLGYKDVLPLCPSEIDVACHNSTESATLSGPADVIKILVANLQSRGIFAKEVQCANIPYHSRYISHAGPDLLRRLREVIKEPKLRSKKWISTSVPQNRWDGPIAKHSSPEYHTNNLLNPVLFEESSMCIPGNAVVIEVAPHGLLQAILKRSHKDCTHIPMTRRGHMDPVKFLLEAVGKLYQQGFDCKVSALYPKIEYPVATGSPLLSHFVEWEHSEDWPEVLCKARKTITSPARKFVMSLHDDDYKYFAGHVRNGNIVFPESGILFLIWETLAMYKGVDFRNLSVGFRDIHFYSEVIIETDKPMKLNLNINKGSERFEVNYNGIVLAKGYVEEIKNLSFGVLEDGSEIEKNLETIFLNTRELYKLLHVRGHSYKNEFQSIHSSNVKHSEAQIKWTGNWITFLDSLIQLNILARDHKDVSTPKVIKKLTIYIKEFKNAILNMADKEVCFNAKHYNVYQITRCAGVEIQNIIFDDKSSKSLRNVVETSSFRPQFFTEKFNIDFALQTNLQIVANNITKDEVTVKIVTHNITSNITSITNALTNYVTRFNIDIHSIKLGSEDFEDLTQYKQAFKNVDLIIVEKLLGNKKKNKKILEAITSNTFVLTSEHENPVDYINNKMFSEVSNIKIQGQHLILLKKAETCLKDNVIFVQIKNDDTFSWIPRVHSELQKTRKVMLVSEKQAHCGLTGLVMSLKKIYKDRIGLIWIEDECAPPFNPETAVYKEQLQKNLIFNVFKKGQWGGYYNLLSDKVMSAEIQNFMLASTFLGDMDNLTWMETPLTLAGRNLVQVHYAGTSVRDSQKAVGIIKTNENKFGMDYSGVDNNGQRVMGLVPAGAIASTVEADLDLLWPVPEHWSLEDAATVPLPYVHAYYCLTIKGQLRRGQSVLVTGGAGALGQAVIGLCLSLGCTVFTTVSGVEKKRLLMTLFPALNVNNIGYSRDVHFRDMVVFNSNNKCCDFVINCLNGPLREAAMKCVGFVGFFLDVNDYDVNENKDIGMFYLEKDRAYKAVRLSNIFRPENTHDKKRLQIMISEGIANGTVRPLTRVVYPTSEVCSAFRFLSSNKHRGRVIVSIKDSQYEKRNFGTVHLPRIHYSPEGAYIVICDDDDNLGIELADHLLKNGARNLMLHLNQKTLTGFLHAKLMQWKKHGATVKMSSENLQIKNNCLLLLSEGAQMGNVHGIFITQESSKTSTISLRQDDFMQTFNKTSKVIINLDLLTRNNIRELKYFAVITCLPENTFNEYRASFSDSICRSRKEAGFPALALRIQFLNEMDLNFDYQSKLQPQTLSATFNAMEMSLKNQCTNVLTYSLKICKNIELMKKITKTLDVVNLDDINETLTVNNLITNEVNLEELRVVIKEMYNLEYTMEKLKEIPITSLKNLNKIHANEKTNIKSGLGVFYTFVDFNEIMATEPLISMQSILSSVTEKEEELDAKDTYLIMIPGFEGHHHIFEPVCERLKIRAVTFQLGPDMRYDSVHDMAVSVYQMMKKRFQAKDKFYLFGYSFGVDVVLELAALLERDDIVGVVYCLDSSPDALRVQLDAYLGNLTDKQLQSAIIEYMYRLISGQDNSVLKEELKALGSWPQKVDACVKKIKGIVTYTTQYIRDVLDAAYSRIMLARTYEPDFTLKSELVLIRGIPHPGAGPLAEDYGLSKYSERPVRVFHIAADHASAPRDCRVSNIVNSSLDPGLLEEFKKRSLCESYVHDPFKME